MNKLRYIQTDKPLQKLFLVFICLTLLAGCAHVEVNLSPIPTLPPTLTPTSVLQASELKKQLDDIQDPNLNWGKIKQNLIQDGFPVNQYQNLYGIYFSDPIDALGKTSGNEIIGSVTVENEQVQSLTTNFRNLAFDPLTELTAVAPITLFNKLGKPDRVSGKISILGSGPYATIYLIWQDQHIAVSYGIRADVIAENSFELCVDPKNTTEVEYYWVRTGDVTLNLFDGVTRFDLSRELEPKMFEGITSMNELLFKLNTTCLMTPHDVWFPKTP